MAGGAFDGLVATIVDMDERDRLTVLMDLMNRPIKVKIEERQISPV
jgi:transcriptional antiterminator RfaH